jgi:hypothetical protein
MRRNISRTAAITLGLSAMFFLSPARAATIGVVSMATASVACVPNQPIQGDFETGPISSAASQTESGIPQPGFCGTSTFDENFESAEAMSAANLATGQLRAYALAADAPGTPNGASAYAFAYFVDTLTIIPPGAATTFSDVATLYLTIDGTVAGYGAISGQIGASNAVTSFGPIVQGCNYPAAGTPQTPVDQSACNIAMQVQVPFSSADPSFTFKLLLAANGIGYDLGEADAFNTAQAGVILPPGYTFTSASGVFLTQQGESTPEPASVVLLSMGLMALAWIKRRVATPTV